MELPDISNDYAYEVAAMTRDQLEAKYLSAVRTLQEISDMGRKAGSELSRHRLVELGVGVPDYGSMT